MTTKDLITTGLAGTAAGAVGTLAMDLLWYRRARADGNDSSFGDYELSRDTTSFDDAGAPAQIGRKAAAAVGVRIPDRDAGLTNDIVHWMIGIGWAIGGAVLAARTGVPPLAAGVASGFAAFGASYAVLPLLGVYQPIWQYDAATVGKDATAHATFGAATGLALTLIGRLGGRD